MKLVEDQHIEFKSAFNEDVIETLVAFANTKGGRVLIGVSDNGKPVKDFTIGKESMQQWLNQIKTKTQPSIIPDMEVREYDGSEVVEIIVQEFPVKPISYRGRYYKRVKNSNHQLNVSEIADMHLKTFNISWDYYLNNEFVLDDISLEKASEALDRLRERGYRIGDDPYGFLLKSDLIRDGKLTNAAWLLFKNKESIITTIELGRFQTPTLIKDSQRSKEDVITQVDEVMNFVKKHINKEVIISGNAVNQERWQYPLDAIREIVMNMIVHRDYRSASDSIVKIFDDRIEFYNPGRLPDEITVDDLLNNRYKSTPRNKLIADVFKNLGMIEKYGSGVHRIISLFSEMGLPMPGFQNQGIGFLVTAFGIKDVGKDVGKDVDKLNSRQQKILTLIRATPQISAEQLASKIGINKRNVQLSTKKLRDSGFIKRIGPDKGGYWEIVKQTDQNNDK